MKMRKVILGAIFLAFFLTAPNNASGNYGEYILGFNSGYTWGIKGIHAGVNLQCYFFSHWGVQLELHHQRRADQFDPFTVYYLNLIYRVTDKKKEKFSWYISAGVGMWGMDPSMLLSKVGNGMKYSFSPHLSLHLGFSAWPFPLFIKSPYGFKLFPSGGAFWFSLHIGLEYGF